MIHETLADSSADPDPVMLWPTAHPVDRAWVERWSRPLTDFVESPAEPERTEPDPPR